MITVFFLLLSHIFRPPLISRHISGDQLFQVAHVAASSIGALINETENSIFGHLFQYIVLDVDHVTVGAGA